MINFKEEIAKIIEKAIDLEYIELVSYIEVPKEKNMGDYAFPCFRLAKTLKKAPQAIAEEVKQKLELDEELIEKTEVAGGYLNFYIKKQALIKTVLNEFDLKKEEYRKIRIWKRKKYYCRIFFSKYCQTFPYRSFKNNFDRKCII